MSDAQFIFLNLVSLGLIGLIWIITGWTPDMLGAALTFAYGWFCFTAGRAAPTR